MSKELNMQIEESKVEGNTVVKDDKTPLGVYPSDMRMDYERQGSRTSFKLKPIKGVRRRWLNLEYRNHHSTKGLHWQPDDPAVQEKRGDLVSGFVPEDMAVESRKRNYEKGIGRLKRDQEQRRELAEKMYYDSDGKIKMEEYFSTDGQKSNFKKPGQTKYFYGK